MGRNKLKFFVESVEDTACRSDAEIIILGNIYPINKRSNENAEKMLELQPCCVLPRYLPHNVDLINALPKLEFGSLGAHQFNCTPRSVSDKVFSYPLML